MRNILTRSVLGAALLASTAAIVPASAQNLEWWTTENQPVRIARQEALIAQYEAATGVSIDLVPIEESDLNTRVTAAFSAGDLPDIVQHPLTVLGSWADAGILDDDAAGDVIAALGQQTFAPGALDMARVGGTITSVPTDGWTQMILYRTDLFDAAGLAAPDSYADIQAALAALHNPPSVFGFVAATKVDESYMEQLLEHVFLANGIRLVAPNGQLNLDRGRTIEALNFYKSLADASPEGELFWQQSRELYLAGQAAMIIWSPFILDELAGLRDSAPPTFNSDPTSSALAEVTGVVTTLAGPSNAAGASWGSVTYLGITTDADTDAATAFVEFALSEGYGQILGIAPEGKFPVRRGTQDDPSAFIDLWSTLDVGVDRKASLASLYPASVIQEIVSGLDTADRWGVAEGQLVQASKFINSRVLNRLVREFIDGERSVESTYDALVIELTNI